MADDSVETERESVQSLLDKIRAGDLAARDRLLRQEGDRLSRQASKMLRCNPDVARWAQTGDVLQEAEMKFCRAIEQQVIPETERRFYQFMAVQIHRTLIDLARKYRGPQGIGANHHTPALSNQPWDGALDGSANDEGGMSLDKWTEFHEAVQNLPDDPREVFDLLWYRQMSQSGAAEVLGITEPAVRYRWRNAKLALVDALGDDFLL